MSILLIIVASLLCFLTVLWLFRIAYSYIKLKDDRKHPLTQKGNKTPPHIYILLPVLNEDKRLREFVDYFIGTLTPTYPKLRLVIITTEKESVEYPNSKTQIIAKRMSQLHTSIQYTHYPNTHGVMAHQLNHAINDIPDEGLIAVYNADSRPELATFQWVAQHYTEGKSQMFQQYGIYTRNISFLRTQKNNNTLIANSYWQLRWSIGFEYYRARSTIEKRRWPIILKPFNYCIGHGLFITSTLIKTIRFSQDTTNEDAVLGIIAVEKNISLEPIPYFDLSESPDSLRSIYLQKSNWIQGPLQSPLYYKQLKNKSETRHLLALFCAKLFSHAVYWVVGPLIVTLAVVLSIVVAITTNPLFIFFIILPFIFLVLPAYATSLVVNSLKPTKQPTPIKETLVVLMVGALPAYLVHGAAGLRGILLSKKIANGFKQKTTMQQYGEG